MSEAALRRDPEAGERRRLLGNQAQVAILAGRLAAEDLGNPMSARTYYGLACDSAREAGDEHLTALAHGYAARLAAAEGMTTSALEHVALAVERTHSRPSVACWLATIQAMLHAARGELAAAREALDRAHAALPAGRAHPQLLNAGTAATLAAATGHVLLRAGDYGGAREALTTALDQLHPSACRDLVLVLVDLAMVELHSGDLPAACSWATRAGGLLQQAAYALGADRLRVFRTAAQPLLSSRALRVLDEHLSRIAA